MGSSSLELIAEIIGSYGSSDKESHIPLRMLPLVRCHMATYLEHKGSTNWTHFLIFFNGCEFWSEWEWGTVVKVGSGIYIWSNYIV